MANSREERNIGLDLLRIILALMVVTIHFNAPGTGQVYMHCTTQPLSTLISLVVALTYPAVNTYVLISGYYSFKNPKTYRKIVSSLVRLWLCLAFFSIVGYLIVSLFNNQPISFTVLLTRLFPLTRSVWWFMSVYFVLMLISPCINKVISSFSKQENMFALLLMLIICSVLPFFVNWKDAIGTNYGYSLVWFVVIYFTGALMCLYTTNDNSHLFVKGISVYFLLSILFVGLNYLLNRISFTQGNTVSMYNSLIVYGQAIALFISFKSLKINNKVLGKVIVFFAGLSLAVYVFHCQEDISKFIWSNIHPSCFANSYSIISIYVVSISGLYFIAVFIEFIRVKLFNLLKLNRGIENCVFFVIDKVNALLTRL
jgi:surface polysaccharide O-acyltransferase-like enzyme